MAIIFTNKLKTCMLNAVFAFNGVARCVDIPFPHHRVGVIIISHKLRPPRRLPS